MINDLYTKTANKIIYSLFGEYISRNSVFKNMHHGREAVFDAIKVYPLCLAKPSFIAAITLLFLPFSVSKYLLTKLGKLSPDSTISCD
jgi:hypothetical protein